MCTHPSSAWVERISIIKGYAVRNDYCRICKVEKARERRARMAGRVFGLNEYLAQFARKPVLGESHGD